MVNSQLVKAKTSVITIIMNQSGSNLPQINIVLYGHGNNRSTNQGKHHVVGHVT